MSREHTIHKIRRIFLIGIGHTNYQKSQSKLILIIRENSFDKTPLIVLK